MTAPPESAQQAGELSDPECVCRGNWRLILKECGHLIGKKFRDRKGVHWTFFGLVHGDDDYYYGMWREPGETVLASCVGNLASNGYTAIDGQREIIAAPSAIPVPAAGEDVAKRRAAALEAKGPIAPAVLTELGLDQSRNVMRELAALKCVVNQLDKPVIARGILMLESLAATAATLREALAELIAAKDSRGALAASAAADGEVPSRSTIELQKEYLRRNKLAWKAARAAIAAATPPSSAEGTNE